MGTFFERWLYGLGYGRLGNCVMSDASTMTPRRPGTIYRSGNLHDFQTLMRPLIWPEYRFYDYSHALSSLRVHYHLQRQHNQEDTERLNFGVVNLSALSSRTSH